MCIFHVINYIHNGAMRYSDARKHRFFTNLFASFKTSLIGKICILASMLVGHVCLFVCTVISQNLKNESANHHHT